MVRAFAAAPVDPAVVDGLIDLARRAPAAGNSQGMAYVVLSGTEETAR
jgi:nitroreductase